MHTTRGLVLLVVLLVVLIGGRTAPAQEDGSPSAAAILPPTIPWSGGSESLIVADDDPWITDCERSGLRDSPDYDDTMAWLRRLVDATPELQLVPIGESPERRTIWMVIASKEGASDAASLAANGRPTVLAQAGIHSGEIDGKDAGLMLLRDLTVARDDEDLLAGCNLLFIPIPQRRWTRAPLPIRARQPTRAD